MRAKKTKKKIKFDYDQKCWRIIVSKPSGVEILAEFPFEENHIINNSEKLFDVICTGRLSHKQLLEGFVSVLDLHRCMESLVITIEDYFRIRSGIEELARAERVSKGLIIDDKQLSGRFVFDEVRF